MNKKLTTPIAVLIGSFIIAGSNLYKKGLDYTIIPEVKADVAGMDYQDLKNDEDFNEAVESIVIEYLVNFNYVTSSQVKSIVSRCLVNVKLGELLCL